MSSVHYLFPPDGSEPRGGFVVMEPCLAGWCIRHYNTMGGRRLLHQTIWTRESLDRTMQEADRLGAEPMFEETDR